MVGSEFKKIRQDIGLSQSKLSELTGINQALLSSYELGKSSICDTKKKIITDTLDALDSSELSKLKKKRFRKEAIEGSCVAERERRKYELTDKNHTYLNSLKGLEEKFFNNKTKMKAVSFFAGCGGLCYGVKAAGFNIVATNELESAYQEIYKDNFGGARFLTSDITQIKDSELESITKEHGELDLMIGGPPCQGFSLAGKRDVNDSRNSLFENYLHIASMLKPKVILMENVRLLTSMKDPDGNLVSDRVLQKFKEYGYTSSFYHLNAKDYGVAQHRERVFFIGIRNDLEMQPSVPEALNKGVLSQPMTFGDAVSDLEFLESGEKSATDKDHKAVKHPEHVLRWLVDVPQGKSAHDNEDETLRPPSGYNTTYKRQVWGEPAGTVGTTYSMISGCRNVHPIATRSLTTREALRLQSFPDSFKVKGNQGDIRTTIGNAVPPLLAYALAKHIKNNYIL